MINQSTTKCRHCDEYVAIKWRIGTRLWDFLKLIVVPVSLILIGAYLTRYQSDRDTKTNATIQSQQAALNATAEAQLDERDATRSANQAALQGTTEANRANADTLQSYLDDMSTTWKEDLENENVRSTAKSRTWIILSELDSKRNNSVLQFLKNTELNTWILVESNLSGADLRSCNLREFNLHDANLSKAKLNEASLGGANLSLATMNGVNLTKAQMWGTDLSGAILREANLTNTNLTTANLSEADLTSAKYNANTNWPDDFDPRAAGAILVDDEGNPIESSD
jgi:uncharacterized protein YjbI with pentapeptide repeats